MGQFQDKFREMSGRNGSGNNDGNNPNSPNFDPDEKWSNLYREREKNHLYKWVGPRSGNFCFYLSNYVIYLFKYCVFVTLKFLILVL